MAACLHLQTCMPSTRQTMQGLLMPQWFPCRVDALLPPTPSASGATLAGMAAAAVLNSDSARLGTAAYLLASMFNHSCLPNVNVVFPEASGGWAGADMCQASMKQFDAW